MFDRSAFAGCKMKKYKTAAVIKDGFCISKEYSLLNVNSSEGRYMKKLILLYFSILASIAAAQQSDGNSNSGDDYVIVKTQSNTIVEDTSEFHRLKKKHGIHYQVIGVGPNARNSTGLIYNYFLTRNDLLVFEYLTDIFSGYGTRSYNIKTSSFGVHYKRFTGNSFYIRAGLDQRFIDYDYNSTFLSSPESSSFKGMSTTVGLAIGNQWQWSNWSIGCDWFGYSFPVLSSITNENFIATPGNYAKTNMESDQKIFVTGNTIYLLRLYAGYNF